MREKLLDFCVVITSGVLLLILVRLVGCNFAFQVGNLTP